MVTGMGALVKTSGAGIEHYYKSNDSDFSIIATGFEWLLLL
jgi:hypothetical protein